VHRRKKQGVLKKVTRGADVVVSPDRRTAAPGILPERRYAKCFRVRVPVISAEKWPRRDVLREAIQQRQEPEKIAPRNGLYILGSSPELKLGTRATVWRDGSSGASASIEPRVTNCESREIDLIRD